MFAQPIWCGWVEIVTSGDCRMGGKSPITRRYPRPRRQTALLSMPVFLHLFVKRLPRQAQLLINRAQRALMRRQAPLRFRAVQTRPPGQQAAQGTALARPSGRHSPAPAQDDRLHCAIRAHCRAIPVRSALPPTRGSPLAGSTRCRDAASASSRRNNRAMSSRRSDRGRHPQRHDVQPIQQIGAEPPRATSSSSGTRLVAMNRTSSG